MDYDVSVEETHAKAIATDHMNLFYSQLSLFNSLIAWAFVRRLPMFLEFV